MYTHPMRTPTKLECGMNSIIQTVETSKLWWCVIR